ncbi:MAG: alpha-E domain-containing protein [Thiotrichales bacterium]
MTMLSRVAENIYWMARYTERAENLARLINVNAFLLLDLPKGVRPGWEPLIHITGSRAEYEARYKNYDERSVVKYLIGDTDNPGSIHSSVLNARENSRTVRDALPRWVWEQLTELYLYVKENISSGITKKGRHEFLTAIIEASHLQSGTLAATMSRDEAYQFLRIGRNLERADMTTRIIDVRTSNLLPDTSADLRPFEAIQWMSVLKSLSAYHMYRKNMNTHVTRSNVLEFLMQDVYFPRSFHHNLIAVQESLAQLPNNDASMDQLEQLIKIVRSSHVPKLKQQDLHEFIDKLQLGLSSLHASISATYFPQSFASQMQKQVG